MKTVSTEYATSMKQILRNPSHVRIVFQNVDKSATSDGTWVDNGHISYSKLDTLYYERQYGATIATLELNRWMLDGSQKLVPLFSVTSVVDGYISDVMSDDNGEYTTAPTLTREFTSSHSLEGLTLIFDSRCEEYPVSVDIEFYLSGTLIDTISLEGMTSSQITSQHLVEEYDKIIIKPSEMLPYRRFRMECILFGVMHKYGNSDIVSTYQSHDVDPLSRRLPSESLSFTILDFDHNYDPDNPQGIYAYIEEKSPISITFGYELDDDSTEWVKADRYLLNSKPSVKNERVTFEATGLIGSLGDTYYKSLTGQKNLYDMAVAVLTDANLGLTYDGTHPWTIDNSLKTMYTTAVLPIDTHMNCLQLIAHAACCKLYTDDDNIIHITPFSIDIDDIERTSDFIFDFSTITEKTQIATKIDQLKSVSVTQYAYTVSDVVTTLYEEETTETSLHVEFEQPAENITISVSGGSIVSQSIYGRAVDMTLTSGTKTITITGKTLSENTVVFTTSVNSKGEVDVEENPLITNESMRTALAQHVAEYLALRTTYEVEYRGNPELEVGDIVGMKTRYTNNMPVMILTDEITFNGGLQGAVKVKGLI